MEGGAAAETGVPHGLVRGPQSLVAGLALVALGLFALWLTRDLSQGTLRAMGPAMLPRWLAVGVAICGVALIAAAFLQPGHVLESTTIRGPVVVLIGVLAFGATIRGLQVGPLEVPPLGMIVAGPLAIFIAGYATPEARARELVIMALALTAGCMILFGDLLNLPIPLYPQWLSDLYPAGWSNDVRLRVTALIMAAAATGVHLTAPRHPAREPVDVVPDERSGIV